MDVDAYPEEDSGDEAAGAKAKALAAAKEAPVACTMDCGNTNQSLDPVASSSVIKNGVKRNKKFIDWYCLRVCELKTKGNNRTKLRRVMKQTKRKRPCSLHRETKSSSFPSLEVPGGSQLICCRRRKSP